MLNKINFENFMGVCDRKEFRGELHNHLMVFKANDLKTTLATAISYPSKFVGYSTNFPSSFLVRNIESYRMGIEDSQFEFCFDFDGIDCSYYIRSNEESGVLAETLYIGNKKVLHIDKRKSYELELNLEGAETLRRDLSSNPKIVALRYVYGNSIQSNEVEKAVIKGLVKFFEDVKFVNTSLSIESLKMPNSEEMRDVYRILSENDEGESVGSFLRKFGFKWSTQLSTYNDNKLYVCCDNFQKSAIKVMSQKFLYLTLVYARLSDNKPVVIDDLKTYLSDDEIETFLECVKIYGFARDKVVIVVL